MLLLLLQAVKAFWYVFYSVLVFKASPIQRGFSILIFMLSTGFPCSFNWSLISWHNEKSELLFIVRRTGERFFFNYMNIMHVIKISGIVNANELTTQSLEWRNYFCFPPMIVTQNRETNKDIYRLSTSVKWNVQIYNEINTFKSIHIKTWLCIC